MRLFNIRRMAVGVLAAVSALMMFTGAGSASAATNPGVGGVCQQWHHVASLNQIPVYAGTFCFGVKSDSSAPYGALYNFSIVDVTPICDYWVDFDYYSSDDSRPYFHNQGQQVNRCTRFGHGLRQNAVDLPPFLLEGSICSSLYTRVGGEISLIKKICGHTAATTTY